MGRIVLIKTSSVTYWSELMIRLTLNFVLVGFLFATSTPEQFGLFSAYVAGHSILTVIVKFGCDNYLLANWGWRICRLNEIIKLRVLAVLVTVLVVCPVIWINLGSLPALMYCCILFFGIGVEREQILIADDNLLLVSKIKLLASAIVLSLKAGAIWFELPPLFIFLIFACDIVILNILFNFFASMPSKHSNWSECGSPKLNQVLSDCWPLAIAGLAAILYSRVDQLIIFWFLGEGALAPYAMAIRLTDLSLLICSLYVGLKVPFLARLSSQKTVYKRKLRQLYRNSYLLNLAFTICASLTVFFSPVPTDNTIFCYILVVGLGNTFGVMGVIYGRNLIIKGQSKLVLQRTLFGLVMNLIVSFALIRVFGVWGVAIGTVAAQIGANLLYDLVVGHKSDLKDKLFL